MQGSSYPPMCSWSRFGTVSDHTDCQAILLSPCEEPLSPFEVELFVARVSSGRRAHAHPPGPTCYQVKNSPRQLRLYGLAALTPSTGFAPVSPIAASLLWLS